MTRRRAQSLLESFNFAFEGVIHVLRTHRNMRIHFAIATIVLVTAVAIGVDKAELIAWSELGLVTVDIPARGATAWIHTDGVGTSGAVAAATEPTA